MLMSGQKTQSFANHTRRHPPFHFFLIPVLLLNLIFSIVHVVRHPGLVAAWLVILSAAILLLALLVRMNPVKVQDRLIRLEERLRLTALLPEPLRARIPELTEKQLVALRFASDEEIPKLVEETLSRNLDAKEIKKKIQNWRPDYFRV
jgi:hypothetical protein